MCFSWTNPPWDWTWAQLEMYDAFIRRLDRRKPARTLLLTTHYMVEADELCDRVAIINKGKVLACDTPDNLKHSLQQEAIFRMEVSLNGYENRNHPRRCLGLTRFPPSQDGSAKCSD
jgi:ABC-type multidrug transport system ATPase subunit